MGVLVLLASFSPARAASLGGLRGDPPPPQSSPTEDDRTASDQYEDENVVQIDPFTTNLLQTYHPLGIEDDNLLSGVVSSYVTRYLSGILDEPPVDLDIDCAKYQRQIGPEVQWVLEIEGVATFDEPPEEDIVAIIQRAFEGTDHESFLTEVYPWYERNYESHQLSRGKSRNFAPRILRLPRHRAPLKKKSKTKREEQQKDRSKEEKKNKKPTKNRKKKIKKKKTIKKKKKMKGNRMMLDNDASEGGQGRELRLLRGRDVNVMG